MYAPTLASCLAGIPRRILTLHNPVYRHSPLRGFVERRVLGRLSRIVTVTDYMKSELIEKKGVEPQRVSVISNGVDIEEFKDAFTRAEALAAIYAAMIGWLYAFVSPAGSPGGWEFMLYAFGTIALGLVHSGAYAEIVARNGAPHDMLARLLGFPIDSVTISGETRLHEKEILAATGIDGLLSDYELFLGAEPSSTAAKTPVRSASASAPPASAR